jgi:hypothetical protein
MPIPVVHAIDAGGKELCSELLAPLFVTLAPGFEAGADELRLQATRAEGHDFQIVCSYIRGGATFPLSVAAGYHPWITSSRIRIICGMSILPDIPHQDGSMTVRFGERTISVRVQVTAENGTEIMKYQPMWDRNR